MPSRRARADCVMPSGLTNSSSNISPGWVGGRRSGRSRPDGTRRPCLFAGLRVVLRDLDFVDIAVLPAEADSEFLVDPDAVLTVPVAVESFEPGARRRRELEQRADPVQLVGRTSFPGRR